MYLRLRDDAVKLGIEGLIAIDVGYKLRYNFIIDE